MLAIFGMGILLIDLMLPQEWKRVNAWTALVGLAFSAAAVWKIQLAHYLDGKSVVGSYGYIIDGLGSMKVDTSPFISGICSWPAPRMAILMSVKYLEVEHENHGEFYALMLFSVIGMMCMAAGYGHRPALHWPGTDGHLHLRSRRIPAPRQAVERSRAEVSVARRFLLRHLRLWTLAALWFVRQHQSRKRSPRAWQALAVIPTTRSPSSRC